MFFFNYFARFALFSRELTPGRKYGWMIWKYHTPMEATNGLATMTLLVFLTRWVVIFTMKKAVYCQIINNVVYFIMLHGVTNDRWWLWWCFGRQQTRKRKSEQTFSWTRNAFFSVMLLLCASSCMCARLCVLAVCSCCVSSCAPYCVCLLWVHLCVLL